MHQIEYRFSKFSRGYRPGGRLGGPQNCTNVMNYPDKLTNASKCTKLNIDYHNVLGGDTPEPASLSGKEHTWAGKTRTSEIFFLLGIGLMEYVSSPNMLAAKTI